MVRGGCSFAFFCLATSHIPAQQCPIYPRDMDEVFVCCGAKPNFEQNASIHNPTRFTFGDFPNWDNYTVRVDFKDGQCFQDIVSGETKTITYPAGSSGQIAIEWQVTWSIGNPPEEIDHGTSGIHAFQLNFNDAVSYVALRPDATWDDISGATYTPTSNTAYPGGSPYKAAHNFVDRNFNP